MTVLFGNGRASALKWCASRIHRIKITDFSGKNVKKKIVESVFWSVKSVIFIRYIRDAHHFKAEALPFPKSTITFL